MLGLDCMAVERCWEAGYPVTFDILRDRRIGLVALAGVDLAVWDAVGQALGQPLWRLWGGYRDRVPMIAIGGYYDSPWPIADEIAAYREMGLAGCKFKVGGRSPAEDAERVAAARAAAGDDFVLVIDANQGYTVAEAVDLARRVAGLSRALVRGAVPVAQRPPRPARRAHAGRSAGVRRPERALGQRLPRPDGGRGDRRLQLRLVVVGRADGVAALRRRRPRLRRRRWPTTRSHRSACT